MYVKIIDEIKHFLSLIEIDAAVINADEFQGVFVKKLSNQNIIKEKRNIREGCVSSPVNQTHIDITGNSGMLFFFENLTNTTTSIQNIDIDVFVNNVNYLSAIENRMSIVVDGYTIFSRTSTTIINLINTNSIYHSTAFKKYGHAGNQVQLNIPDQDEYFTQLHNLAYLNDALVLLRYNYSHYLAIIIPNESCGNLYSLTQTIGNQNINVSVINPSYNFRIAEQLQSEHIAHEIEKENIELESLQKTLLYNEMSGTDISKMMKSRISQGAFRQLLMIVYHHKCCLCDVTTTSVLRASHIKAWSNSSREERLDINNGLLLCANHDTLFDKHLISFNPDSGMICISKSIDENQRNALNISNTKKIAVSTDMRTYMELHRNIFNDKDNN